MKKAIPVICAIVLIVVIGAVAFGGQIIEKYSYSSEKADLYEYFHIMKEEQVAIILQNEIIEEKAIMVDGVNYFDLATVHNYFNDRFYVDVKEGLLLYTTPTQIMRTVIGTNVYDVDGEETDAGYLICFLRTVGEEDTYYIAVDYVKQYTNFSYEVFDEPKHMQVYTEWIERKVADVTKDNAVRERGGVKSPILAGIAEGDTVIILEEMENWSKVKTKEAFIGYIENKVLDNERSEIPTAVTDYQIPEYTSLTSDTKVCMGWHAIFGVAGNDTFNTMVSNTKGMNVIAPTWFSLNDNLGHFQSFAQTSYVDRAHNQGIKVWAVVDDFNYKGTSGADIDVYEVLSQTTTRTTLIEGLVEAAATYKFDGINIDFENINSNSGEHFIQFIRELSIKCRENQIVLSIDNYVPYNFNAYYDLDEQGVVADYVIIMGYDEHWSGSQDAGSVASIGYVKYGLEKATGMVPAKKVINALPFYTRLWKTTGVTVSSEAYPMTSVSNVLSQYGMTAEWDEETNQNYATKEANGTTYQMWIEDSESILAKVNVMKNFNIGGVAAWRLGYEPASIWDILSAYASQ